MKGKIIKLTLVLVSTLLLVGCFHIPLELNKEPVYDTGYQIRYENIYDKDYHKIGRVRVTTYSSGRQKITYEKE